MEVESLYDAPLECIMTGGINLCQKARRRAAAVARPSELAEG